MIFVALITGYLVGSLPTAQTLGRLWGVDLRKDGSKNPGTNNALRLSGSGLAATVLLVEASKGYAAVLLGGSIVDEGGAVAAGLGAVAGNVYNVWYRFSGGKGLGISLGVLLAAWPIALAVALTAIIIAVLITRSSGKASIWAMVALMVASIIWSPFDWPTGGVEATSQLMWLAFGMSAILIQKHWNDVRLKRAGLL